MESSAVHVLAQVERTGDELSVSASIDLRDLQLEQTGEESKGAVEVYLVQQDAAGKTLERGHQNMQLSLDRAHYEEYLRTGVFFRHVLHAKDGVKTLRVIAIDRAHSTVGSVIIPLSEVK
jgi:hypothetical protein